MTLLHVLSLFPGIGLFDMALELEGYSVVRGPDVLWGGDIRLFYPPAGKYDGVIGGPPCQTFSLLARLVRANGHEPKFGNLIPEFERCVREAAPDWFVMENVPQAPEPVIADYGIKSFVLNNAWLPSGLGDGMGQEQERKRRFSFGVRGREPINLMRFIDLAVFMLPKANPAVFGDGRPTRQEVRHAHETITGGNDRPPSQRKLARTVTALGQNHLASLSKSTTAARNGQKAAYLSGGRYRLEDACRLQGLSPDFLKDAPFTAEGKLKAVANGVPIPMGRAIAKAVKEAIANA